MRSSKVYPHAPVALALLQVRHPAAPELSTLQLGEIKAALSQLAPIHRTEIQQQLLPFVSPEAQRPVIQPKFLSRDQRTAITFAQDAITIETTAYPGWEEFREIVQTALAVRQEVAPADGIERIGLRYVDEIRVPADSPGGSPDWSEWLKPGLLGPVAELAEFKFRPMQQQNVLVSETGSPGETLTLRYGAINGPPVVSSGPGLARADAPRPGHYFLIDLDGAWTLPEGTAVPELDLAWALSVAERLHAPIKDVFESVITEKLRRDVLDVV